MTQTLKKLATVQFAIVVLTLVGFVFDDQQGSFLKAVLCLVPLAPFLAFAFKLPFARLALQAYAVLLTACGALVMAAFLTYGGVSWATPGSLIFFSNVAVAIALLVHLVIAKSAPEQDVR